MIRLLRHTKKCFTNEVTYYTRRGRHRPQISHKVGDKIEGFYISNISNYKDFDLIHMQLSHPYLLTTVHQFECSYYRNTLCLAFKITGLHKYAINYALEKMLQCGSKSYPVRNIVMYMAAHSFSSIDSPLTTYDYLMFSFNSPNLKDFQNLLDVHLSTLFKPLMREEDFDEVVRKLTFEQGNLVYSGYLVGYMASRMFHSYTIIYRIINKHLFGNSKLSICNPIALLDLSFADVNRFYAETITLANCTVLMHGDMDLRNTLIHFTNGVHKYKANKHKPIFAPKEITEVTIPKTVDFDHLNKETMLIISYNIEHATEEEKLQLQILSYLLFDMPYSYFMKFNSESTPYPSLYGYRVRFFNIGISFHDETISNVDITDSYKTRYQKVEKVYQNKQIQLMETLKTIVTNKFKDSFIEKCLMNLEGKYYEKDGLRIIESLIGSILNGKSFSAYLEVKQSLARLLNEYRNKNIFYNLIYKFLLRNDSFIVLRGTQNLLLIDSQKLKVEKYLASLSQNLPQETVNRILNYREPSILQNFAVLPRLAVSELEFFYDIKSYCTYVQGIKTFYNPKHNGGSVSLKFDVTDLCEDDHQLLCLFCEAFPHMGYKGVTAYTYSDTIEFFISSIKMSMQTSRFSYTELKLHLILKIYFIDRNYERAFALLNGLLHDFNHNNLEMLSLVIQQAASNCFHDVSRNLLHYHGIHLASSQSPFAFFDDPIAQARVLCGIAGEILKVTNPKNYLLAIRSKIELFWLRMVQKTRMEVLLYCSQNRREFYHNYLDLVLSQVPNSDKEPAGANISDFPFDKWMKYFPNYAEEVSFEAFKVPYRSKYSPVALVLSSMINRNISVFNKVGGCFLYKGALVSFIKGSRSKYLELEDYYKRIDDIELAKKSIFQHWGRYTAEEEFMSGITIQQAKFFKQAVIAVELADVQRMQEEVVLKGIKENGSSMLALGPRLYNYDPLLKKGWVIERSIDGVSLGMYSSSQGEIQFQLYKYVTVC